jgi:hypothetical protein
VILLHQRSRRFAIFCHNFTENRNLIPPIENSFSQKVG